MVFGHIIPPCLKLLTVILQLKEVTLYLIKLQSRNYSYI